MSSYFKGLSEFHRSKLTPNNNFLTGGEVFIGQVLNIIKSNTTDGDTVVNEDLPLATGVIRFNKANVSKKPEDQIIDLAEPLDRGNYRLPVVGEQVLLVKQRGHYYYFTVLSSAVNLLLNVDPNLLLNEYESTSEKKISVDPEIQRKRFESRSDFEEATLLKKAGLFSKIREGETILEGRLGGVIKFTHTVTKEGVWDTEKQIANIGTSTDGDPMLIMKANIRRKSYEDLGFIENALEDDDVKEDLSSFYLTTSQKVPLKVNCSQKSYTWNLNITRGKSQALEDTTARLGELFPDAYDPSDVVSVNVIGVGTSPSAGGGGADFSSTIGGTWQQTAANFIAKKEGFTAVGTWDVNHFRAGYGSDKIYKNGVLTTVTQGMSVTQEEALTTLRDYSIPKYANQIAKDLGQALWTNLSDNQKAALTSLGYNVGAHYISARAYGKKIKDFITANNLQSAGQTIYTDGPKTAGGKLLAGLEKRRREESQLFLT